MPHTVEDAQISLSLWVGNFYLRYHVSGVGWLHDLRIYCGSRATCRRSSHTSRSGGNRRRFFTTRVMERHPSIFTHMGGMHCSIKLGSTNALSRLARFCGTVRLG